MKRVIVVIAGLVVVALVTWRFASRRLAGDDAKPGSAAVGSASGAIATVKSQGDRPLPAWFTMRGVPERRIAGRVTLAGEPVAGATVIVKDFLVDVGLTRTLEAHTGRDGRFAFGLLPPSSYEVAASADGATGAIVQVDLSDPAREPPPDQLELRLRECTAFVEGVVYDAAGNPLPKAQVRRGALGTPTDAEGAYKLCVPFGDNALEYRAEGYGAVVLSIDARGGIRRDVVLVPEASLRVRVIRADTAEPVPDAWVWATPNPWAPDHPRVGNGVTDRDGRAVIDGLVPGRYRIGGWAEGSTSQNPAEAVAEVGGGEAEVTVRLDATSRVRGEVTSNGKPIAGARVTAVRKSPATRSPPATSQLDGSFVLERVPAGEVAFEAAPHEVVSPVSLEAKAGQTHDVVIEVRALGAIRGRITRLGKPAENIEVCCVRTPMTHDPRARTDADGRYEFRGVAPGTYPIGAGSDELGAFTLGGNVTVGPGEEKVADFELDQAGTISGRVVDRDGEPVRGVFVRWMHEKTGDLCRAITDARGRYRCGAMTGGGRYRAAVFPSAQLQQVPYPTAGGAPYPALEVKDGTTVIENVELRIDRPDLSIKGRVLDDAGKPVADAVVKALPFAGGTPRFHSWLRLPLTSTDADGRFTLTELAPGNYVLSARAVDGSEGISAAIVAGTTSAVVRVERAAAIEGKLVGFTQPPVVYARSVGGGGFSLIAGVVDGAGFRVAGLRPGRYQVNAMTTYEGDAQLVELEAGATAKLTMTAKGRGAIDGTVLDFRTRKPIANAICHAVMSTDGEMATTNWDLATAPKSDAQGRVVLEPAPAGTVDVTCEMPVFRWSSPSATTTLAAGSRAQVELLSVELAQDNGSSTGITFDHRVTPPRIAAVTPDSAAAKAGLLAGDLVTKVGDVAVKGLNGAGVNVLIASTPVGDSVRIEVARGGATRSFTLAPVAD